LVVADAARDEIGGARGDELHAWRLIGVLPVGCTRVSTSCGSCAKSRRARGPRSRATFAVRSEGAAALDPESLPRHRAELISGESKQA